MTPFDFAILTGYAPLVGFQRRWPNVYHAVTSASLGAYFDAIKAGRRTIPAACGRSVAIIYPDTTVNWWAPKVRGTAFTRCPECEEACGTRTRRPPKWAQWREAKP